MNPADKMSPIVFFFSNDSAIGVEPYIKSIFNEKFKLLSITILINLFFVELVWMFFLWRDIMTEM